jgi:hypothetical protein
VGENKKNPHHLKLSDRFQSNLKIDANSTFMAIERSRSGINGGMGNMMN